MANKPLTLSKNLTFIMLSGKGGVGKTTCACAAALYCAQRGQKTLLASTDPAHSLADSLGLPVGRVVGPIHEVDNLYAVEMDSFQSLEQFKNDYGNVLKEIANRGTYLDRDDINDIFSLSLPGLDEIMGIITLMDLLDKKEYDVIVLDTAPTGHTIRLLSLPDHMSEWLRVLDLMLEKHRYMASVLVGRYVPDYTDNFIKRMSSKVLGLKKLLTDHTRTQFIPVVIPEAMSLKETEKLVKAVKSKGIPLNQMIVNRVAEDRNCPFCQRRRVDQINTLKEINDKFKTLSQVHLPLFSHEVRGISALSVFAETMINSKNQGVTDTNTTIQTSTAMPIQVRLSGKELAGKKYILFGGKGGVGKTSVAAAAALHLARQGKRTLIFSTDPAHSLSDSFGCSIGNKITSLMGSTCLYGLEIDPQKMLDEFKQQYVEEINEMFNSFLEGTGVDVAFDREVMTELISLMPPGLDEVMALTKIVELSDDKDYDVIIMDTAPTGHLIRMLELPDLALQWLRTFFELVLKYQKGDSLQKTTDLMLEMVRGVRKVQSVLVAPEQTAFIGVTVPEGMIVEETEKLLAGIQNLGVESSWLVVNMVIPPNQCYFCSQVQVQQQSYMVDLRARFINYKMVEIPLFQHQVKGVDDLTELASLLMA